MATKGTESISVSTSSNTDCDKTKSGSGTCTDNDEALAPTHSSKYSWDTKNILGD